MPETAARRLRRNLRLVPFYAATVESIAVIPVLVLWYEAHGVSAARLFLVQAVFAAATVALEVPSGFVADAAGRRTALAVGAVFFPAGFALYRFGGSLEAFVAAEITFAVGLSLQSGCLSALLFDTLASLDRREEYQGREGRMGAVTRLGALAASVAGGLLAVRSLALPLDLDLATHLLLLPAALLLLEPERERPVLRKAWSEILAVARHCFTHPELRSLIVAAAALGSISLTALWASLLSYREWGIPVAWLGALFALLQLGGVAGGWASDRLRRKLGRAGFLALLLLPAPLLLALSLGGGRAGVLAFPAITFVWNAGLPFFYDGLNRLTESRVRATVLSVANMVSRLAFVLLGPLFGALVARVSLDGAYAVLGALALAALGPSLLRVHRDSGAPAPGAAAAP
jgi:hypothetical protein